MGCFLCLLVRNNLVSLFILFLMLLVLLVLLLLLLLLLMLMLLLVHLIGLCGTILAAFVDCALVEGRQRTVSGTKLLLTTLARGRLDTTSIASLSYS